MIATLNSLQETVVKGRDLLPTTRLAGTSTHSADFSGGVKSRIRVLHLVDTLNIGGTENQLIQVVLRMQQAGHHVTVGCLRSEGPLLRVLREAAVPVVEFPKRKTLLSLHGARQLLRLATFLRRGRFDVVHAHDLWANLIGIPGGRLAGTPIVISSRRYLQDLEWYTPWRNWVVRWIYRLSTRVVVNSRAICELLVNRDRVDPEKIQVVYNGVEVERFAGGQTEREKLVPRVGKGSKLIVVLANMYSRVKGHA